jgi:hypothetical protein
VNYFQLGKLVCRQLKRKGKIIKLLVAEFIQVERASAFHAQQKNLLQYARIVMHFVYFH